VGREKERGKKSFCPKRRDQVGKDILVEKRPQQTPSGQSESAAEGAGVVYATHLSHTRHR